MAASAPARDNLLLTSANNERSPITVLKTDFTVAKWPMPLTEVEPAIDKASLDLATMQVNAASSIRRQVDINLLV